MPKTAIPFADETAGGLSGQIYGRLRNALIEGAFASGDRLSIRAVAAKLGTSAMPVRTALRRLATEQAVDLLPSGTAVVPHLTKEAFSELSRIRAELEPLAIRMAAPAVTKDCLTRLEKTLRDQDAAHVQADPEAMLRADRSFLFTVYREARAPLLLQIIESLWLRRGPLFWDARWILVSRKGDTHLHGEIIQALRKQDGERAANALRVEIEAATAFLEQNYFDKGQDRETGLGSLKPRGRMAGSKR
jgi:GntR family colanic acid and biofilm gene transcriptional regulator